MTKSDMIHHIISTWAGERKIRITFEEQSELVEELSKDLMLKKRRLIKTKRNGDKK